jgi:5-methylcytosine-specific restriction endonuclease McrA
MNKEEKRNNDICKLRVKGKSYIEIAKIYNISRQRIFQIIHKTNLNQKSSIQKIFWAVKERDAYKCTSCKAENNLLIHHIDHNPQNNEVDNLVTLCRSCHTRLHIIKYNCELYVRQC